MYDYGGSRCCICGEGIIHGGFYSCTCNHESYKEQSKKKWNNRQHNKKWINVYEKNPEENKKYICWVEVYRHYKKIEDRIVEDSIFYNDITGKYSPCNSEGEDDYIENIIKYRDIDY